MSWVDDAVHALGEDGFELQERLEAFAAAPPTVTLVGAFNTGKSSLIKRLCVDRGEPLPEDLVIDAAPATATSYEVTLDGVRWRDTPGLDSGTVEHGRIAESAALLTDVVLLSVTHELFSLDSDVGRFLRALAAAGPLPAGALRCVILRADDAAGTRGDARFETWSAGKRAELSALSERLGLAGIAVDVAVADARGRNAKHDAGYEPTLAWDGVAAFYAAVTASTGTLAQREAAVIRTVNTELDRARVELELRLEAQVGDTARAVAAAQSEEALRRLDAFTDRAREDLREALIAAALQGPSRSLPHRFVIAYERWSSAHARELQGIARAAGVRVDPWALTEPIPSVELPADDEDAVPEDDDRITERLRTEVAQRLGDGEEADAEAQRIEAQLREWREAKRQNRTREHYEGKDGFGSLRDKRAAEQRLKELRRRQTALAVVNAGIDFWREERAERRRRETEREQAQALRDAATSHAVATARVLFDGAGAPGWKRHIEGVADELRDRLEELGRDDAADALRGAIARLRAVRAAGRG